MTSPYFFPLDNRIGTNVSRAGACLRAVRGFFLSPAFILLCAAVAAISAALGEAHTMTGIVIGAQLFALALVICDDFAAAMTPFLTVMCQGATLYTKWDVILSYLFPWAIFPAAALVFHLIVYRKPLRNGISLYGLVPAAAAILVGGLGTDALASPFENATNAFYYFGLSFGLVLLYFLFSSHYKRAKDYDPYEYFLWQMLFTGLTCGAILFLSFFRFADGDPDFTGFRRYVLFRNSLANIMILGLPAPFYFAKKKSLPVHGQVFAFLLGLFIYFALCFTTSRTALLAGTLLLPLCLIYYFSHKGRWLAKLLCVLILLAAAGSLIWLVPHLLDAFYIETFLKIFQTPSDSVSELHFDEPRIRLFVRAANDFLSHPIFGVGLLSQGNADIYNANVGCIHWYHMYFPQILGSMGLCGTAAYTLLLGTRARLVFFRPSERSVAVSLTALSLFLFSMTDPGEFMPIPFGMMATLAFVLLERHMEAHPDSLFSLGTTKIFKKTQKTIDKMKKI